LISTTAPLWALYICSVGGALMLWVKSSLRHKKMYGFSDVAERLFPSNETAQFFFVFFAFVFLGAAVGLLVGGPDTPRQAFTAGVAWSRFAPTK